MLQDPDQDPQDDEFSAPPIESLDLFAHADPMPEASPEPVQEESAPIAPLLPLQETQQEQAVQPATQTAAPPPNIPPPTTTATGAMPPDPYDPRDPRADSSNKVPPLPPPMPPDPFDQKTGGAGFNLWAEFLALRDEVAILRKQVRDVWPLRTQSSDDGGSSVTDWEVVTCTSDGGSNGGEASKPTWTFTVAGDTVTGTGISPFNPRQVGLTEEPAGPWSGLARLNEGSVELFLVEPMDAGACPDGDVEVSF